MVMFSLINFYVVIASSNQVLLFVWYIVTKEVNYIYLQLFSEGIIFRRNCIYGICMIITACLLNKSEKGTILGTKMEVYKER